MHILKRLWEATTRQAVEQVENAALAAKKKCIPKKKLLKKKKNPTQTNPQVNGYLIFMFSLARAPLNISVALLPCSRSGKCWYLSLEVGTKGTALSLLLLQMVLP